MNADAGLVTRDAATDVVAVYANGVEVLSFVEAKDIAVFNGLTDVIRFRQDDNVSSGAEAADGFVDRIRICSRGLSCDLDPGGLLVVRD